MLPLSSIQICLLSSSASRQPPAIWIAISILLSFDRSHAKFQFELKRCQEMETNLKKQLQAEKEKSYVLEQSMNALISKGRDLSKNFNDALSEV